MARPPMANRIRYVKVEDGVYKSFRRYNGYLVLLYVKLKSFKIIDDLGKSVVEGTIMGGSHQLKVAAKKALMKLGVAFKEEGRDNTSRILKKAKEKGLIE
jgi:hypothetical protein